MRPKRHVLAISLLAATVALGQSGEQMKAHAEHMEHHFDPGIGEKLRRPGARRVAVAGSRHRGPES